MESYDYRENTMNDILLEVEILSERQRQAVHNTIKKIHEETEAENTLKTNVWFDNSILPVLKEYAELTFSVLNIKRVDKGIIQAIFRNSSGLVINETDRRMYMALSMAVQILVDIEDEDTIFTLTFDCRKFAN